jgi:two-component system, NtrC family, response regulator AtoC
VAHFNREHGCDVRGVSPAAMELLRAYSWPGNVRELRNVIERALILFGTEELRSQHLPPHIQAAKPEVFTPPAIDMQGLELETVEKRLLSQAMDKAGGNQTKAARLLGISRDRLRYRLKKHQQS